MKYKYNKEKFSHDKSISNLKNIDFAKKHIY